MAPPTFENFYISFFGVRLWYRSERETPKKREAEEVSAFGLISCSPELLRFRILSDYASVKTCDKVKSSGGH
jgi:hypothetical protein